MKGEKLHLKSFKELEDLYNEEDRLLEEVLKNVVWEGDTERFKLEPTPGRKRFVCTVLQDIYNSTNDEHVRKLVLEAGVMVKRMTRALVRQKVTK